MLVWNWVLITSSVSFNLETINVGELDCEKIFQINLQCIFNKMNVDS